MLKGYYNLTSAMLSQNRRLDVVANNMTNLATAGYKSSTYTDTTFDEVLVSLVGNKDKSGAQVIGGQSYILAPSELVVDFAQGILEETGLNLDFAILDADGFFAVQRADGTVEYTRNGSFSLDDEGYLTLPGHGRVLSSGNEPIYLPTDQIKPDAYGTLYLEDGETYAGTIGVFAFPENGELTINPSGLFGANGQQAAAVQNARIQWKSVERSNVDMIRQMTTMMTSQRALQSAAQVVKIYDELLTKATGEVGRI